MAAYMAERIANSRLVEIRDRGFWPEPWRSRTPFISSKYRDMTRRSDSGSSRSPSAVDPVTSAKRTVTVLRTSRARVGSSASPQLPQKRKPSGFG